MKQGVRATYRGVASNVHRRHGCARTSSFTFLPRDFLSLQGLYDRTLFDEGQLFSSCCRRACVAAELLPKCLLDSTVFELLWFNWTLRFLLEEPGGGLACRYPNERHLRFGARGLWSWCGTPARQQPPHQTADGGDAPRTNPSGEGLGHIQKLGGGS
jgi:hypothetical protein